MEDLKENVKDNAGDLFNELHYAYEDKYNEEKNGLNIKDKKKFDYKKLRLANAYEYESEEEGRKQSDKVPNKKEPPKKPTKIDANEFDVLINKEETDITVNYFKNISVFKDLVKC